MRWWWRVRGEVWQTVKQWRQSDDDVVSVRASFLQYAHFDKVPREVLQVFVEGSSRNVYQHWA